MTMFLVQALIWLLAAFALGFGIGRLLKLLFCREQLDKDVYGMNSASASLSKNKAFRSSVPERTTAAGVK